MPHDADQGGSFRKTEPAPNCPKCHGTGKDDSLEVDWPDGWRGQLGLEPTPDLYVQHIVQVFREVRRVLRDDGTLWLDYGDAYQEKQLLGMPWRVAFALQADGWYLRSDIIWAKPNPMPESVTDRPTKAHEYVFLLTKNANYFYDADAVREDSSESLIQRQGLFKEPSPKEIVRGNIGFQPGLSGAYGSGRNLRTVWTIATQPYPEAHFATFPEALAERCIKAGTSEKGCCATCGAPWERVVKRSTERVITEAAAAEGTGGYYHGQATKDYGAAKAQDPSETKRRILEAMTHPIKTIGFRPTCDHSGDPIPAVVLDPFAGSGTVGQVARNLGRSSILIEIKEEYVELMKERVNYAHKALEAFQKP